MKISRNSLKLLGVLLVAQLGLAVGLNLQADRYNGSFKSDTPLLSLGSRPVDNLLIEDGDGNRVELTRKGGRWVLPQAQNFPVTKGRVDALLKRLAALKISWPVASTSGAAERFKVADDSFRERLTLRQGDAVLARLYVGTSPTYRKANVRVDGEDDIYSVELQPVDMPAEISAWEDKSLLTLNTDDITRVELPGVTLEQKGDSVQVDDLGDGEQTASAESKALINRIANLRYTASAGKVAENGGEQDKKAFDFSLTLKSGEKREYRFTPSADGKDYLLKVSGQPWRFRVSKYTFNSIKSDGRSKLVTASPAASGDGTTSKEAGSQEQSS
jgi:hypothetical protein